VECFFGILKKKFRFLKNPITLQSQGDIDNVFYSCCIIHNMILKHDGLDKLWLDDSNWGNSNLTEIDSEDDEVPFEDEEIGDIYTPKIHDEANFKPLFVLDLIPANVTRGENIQKLEFNALRDLLANNLQLMYQRGELRWPMTRKCISKNHNDAPRHNFPDAGEL
jgi:hypothetical protein